MRNVPFYLLCLFIASCCPHKYKPADTPDPLPEFYVPEKIRVAVVLGSGGVRGMAHVGVLEELEAAGIKIDLLIGCSAGSIVGALYADNPNVEAIKNAVWSIRANSLLDIDILDCRFGICQAKHLNRVLDQYLGADTFEQLKIPLVVVTSDLYSGELVPIGSGDLVTAVQASCSIPFIYVPCEYGGRICVDGGTINPVPVRVAKDLDADIIIAVDLSELLPKTFPTNLFDVADRSAEIVFLWQNERCTKNADVIIRPKTCGIGTFNDKMKGLLYEAGKAAAKEKIPEIQKLLADFPENLEAKGRRRLARLEAYSPAISEEEGEEEEKEAEALAEAS